MDRLIFHCDCNNFYRVVRWCSYANIPFITQYWSYYMYIVYLPPNNKPWNNMHCTVLEARDLQSSSATQFLT